MSRKGMGMGLDPAEQEKRWKISKKKELDLRIAALGRKVLWLMMEIKHFAPVKVRNSFGKVIKVSYQGGMRKHWGKMARVSLMATRKKIEILREEKANL